MTDFIDFPHLVMIFSKDFNGLVWFLSKLMKIGHIMSILLDEIWYLMHQNTSQVISFLSISEIYGQREMSLFSSS